jgi:hypothetical protein
MAFCDSFTKNQVALLLTLWNVHDELDSVNTGLLANQSYVEHFAFQGSHGGSSH